MYATMFGHEGYTARVGIARLARENAWLDIHDARDHVTLHVDGVAGLLALRDAINTAIETADIDVPLEVLA